MKKLSVFVFLSIIFSSCVSTKRNLDNYLNEGKVYGDKQRHFGYLFIDTESGDTLLASNANKYFVPASTTKLFTLYTSLNYIGDSLIGLQYTLKSDTLFIRGTGDPTFLHPSFGQNATLDFLKKHPKIILSEENNFQNSYGKGWMWDDALEYYQAEINSMPLYGNLIRNSGTTDSSLNLNPRFFQNWYTKTGSLGGFLRDENLQILPSKLKWEVPFKTNLQTSADLLSDTLGVTVGTEHGFDIAFENILLSVPKDTVLRKMMIESDNMLAEQLLLQSSLGLSDSLSSEKMITYLLSNDLRDLPQKPRWVDGSGLSRYNLFSPADLTFVLEKMRNQIGLDRLIYYLPANGVNGTLKTFSSSVEPFIFAKSGSMSGVYNLGGYLRASSGRLILFAVMNNNFTFPVSKIRNETAEFLQLVREKY